MEGRNSVIVFIVEEIRALAELLGMRTEREIAVAAFCGGMHDLGRVRRALKFPKDEEPWRHGEDGTELIRRFCRHIIQPAVPDTAYRDSQLLWTIMLGAIEQHSMKDNPTLDELREKYPELSPLWIKALYALTILTRDVDKASNFDPDNVRKYTEDLEFQRRQREVNWAKRRESDPTFGEVKGRILPEEHLETFLQGRAIDRTKCASWEAYFPASDGSISSWSLNSLCSRSIRVVRKSCFGSS